MPHREFLRAVEFGEFLCAGHGRFLNASMPEGDAELGEKSSTLFVGTSRSHERDVHSLDRVDLVVVDLGKNDLLAQAHREVALAVEAFGRNALEIADARQAERDQTIDELP